MITLPQIQKENAEAGEINSGICSLGLVIPFQPSMTERKSVEGILSFTLEMIESKLEGKFEPVEIDEMKKRLQKIFSRLNYNSHRKSIAITIEGKKEKILYLDYSGKPVFIFNENFSILDLVGNSVRNPEFDLLVLKNGGAELYEYFNNSLHKVFGQTSKSCDDESNNDCLFRKISNILKSINSRNDKPVFVFSEDEMLAHQFCEQFPFKEIATRVRINSDESADKKIQLLVQKIIYQWSFYRAKQVKGQVAIAKRTGSLYSHLTEVINALKYGGDGLLLVDDFMKDEIHKTSGNKSFYAAIQKLNAEIEKFLVRGNRIEITKGGALENLGGIAFIKDNTQKFEYHFAKRYHEEDFFE